MDLEYVAARSVLFDALDALSPQLDSFILVGAQAVYAHTGEVPGTGINRTTDGDLALNTEFLEADPEITGSLEAAGFRPGGNPGSWVGAREVKVDIMTVPHQSNTEKKGARAAKLPPHGKRLARITPGLEAALIDNDKHTIKALDPTDVRTYDIAIAGPAALLVAKAIKIKERNEAVRAGSKDRINTKDGVDCLRILMKVEPEDLVAGFRRHQDGAEAEAVSTQALAYFADQLRRGTSDEVRTAIFDQLGDESMAAGYSGAIEELLDECHSAGLI